MVAGPAVKISAGAAVGLVAADGLPADGKPATGKVALTLMGLERASVPSARAGVAVGVWATAGGVPVVGRAAQQAAGRWYLPVACCVLLEWDRR
jgi:hypothetical protein